jgi:PAS domain S-box-containing protein
VTNKQSVLIVDDDPLVADLLSEVLHLTGLYDIEWANNLASLWERLKTSSYDLILLDYRLPDGTGLDALGEMMRQGQETPVVMITGQGDERLVVKAMQAGASDYLVKGSEVLNILPTIVQRAIRTRQLQLTIKHSVEQNRYQALLLENVLDAILVWDAEGRISHLNPAAEALFGMHLSDCIGRPVEQAYFSMFNPPLSLASMNGRVQEETVRQFAGPTGHTVWISSRITRLSNPEIPGSWLGYMDVCRDITARKEAEDSLRAAYAQLAQSTRLATIGELTSIFGHHIHNPLTTIIAEAQLLLRDADQQNPGRESLVAIEEAGWRIQKALQQLLKFSCPEVEEFSTVSVNETIKSAVAFMRDHLSQSGIGLEIDLADDLPFIRGQEHHLQDLWINLLLLARNATYGDSFQHHIRVQSRRLEGPDYIIQVDIADDGETIPPEEMPTLFEPNFLKSLGRRGGGIELSICDEIVRQHLGRIWVESAPVSGAVFHVNFPAEDKQ